MKRSTFQCPKDLSKFIDVLQKRNERLVIIDFHKSQIWSSEHESDLTTFDYPETQKLYFAENEAQANDAFRVILSEQDGADVTPCSTILTVVRPAR